MIEEFEEICDYLKDAGWEPYNDHSTGFGCKDFYKYFKTSSKCLTNKDKPGIQITCHVRQFVGVTDYEFKLRGETPRGWLKIHRYSLPDDFLEGIKVTRDMVSLWEVASVPVIS